MITLTAANAVLTKSRCMYGKMLGSEDYNALMSCHSVSEVAFYLKNHTHYADALAELNESTIHRRQLEELLQMKEFDEFAALCRYEFAKDDGFSQYIIMTGDIRQMLHFLRLLSVGRPQEYLFSLPGFFVSHSTVDLHALSQARSFADFIKVVQKSQYAKALAPFASKDHFDFTAIEHALYRYMYAHLMEIISRRAGQSQKDELQSIFGSFLEMENFLHIYRLKKFYHAEADVIRTLLFNYPYKLKHDTLEAMITADSADEVLEIMKKQPYYGKYFQKSEGSLESVYARLKFSIAKKYVHYSVNPSVVMLSYIILSQIELDNIINIIESVRYGLTAEEMMGMITV